MEQDLARAAVERGIQYFMVTWVDMFGVLRAKLAPASAIGGMQKNGAGFAGFATYLDMTPADPDVLVMPDPSSLIQLPWQPDIGWVVGDPHCLGKPIPHAPRNVLKRQLEAAKALGVRPKSGVEAEFFLISPDGTAPADPRDTAAKASYDQMAITRRVPILREVCDAMASLGWEPYSNDHEDGCGQYELNWTYDDALLTADRHVFFKYLVKWVAEKHGLRATFMGKPFMDLAGSGAHVHVSLWDEAGTTNLFDDPKGELGVSKLGYHFLAGLLDNAPALAALTNPTVNAYKRLNAANPISGSTWAPNTISYTGNNRTHMIRIPDGGRLEFRLADGAVNPYLLQAATIAGGLDGIERALDPGPRMDVNMFEVGHTLPDIPRLPLYLIDSLRELARSKPMRARLGDNFVDAYVKLRTRDWDEHQRDLSAFERQRTLDC